MAHTREQIQQAQRAAYDVCPELNISYICYAGLDDDVERLREEYDHFICDEAHHLAKTTWGVRVKEINPKFIWLLRPRPSAVTPTGTK